MPLVWKDIFRPGTYRDHTGELHRFSSADVVSAYRNGRAMLRNRIPLPVPSIWEHDWSSVPMPKSKFLSTVWPDRDKRGELARNTFGWAEDYKITYEPDPKEKGQLRPVLHALVNAPDERDLKQWEKVRYCSPRVDFDFVDTLGRRWPGCSIAHIAATHSPVQLDQKPVMLGRPASSRTFFLGANMADDKGKKDDKGGAGGGDSMARLKAALASNGKAVPDTAVSLDDICLALEALAMNGGDATEPDNEPDGDEMTDEGDVGSAGGISPTMLSTLPVETQNLILANQRAAEQTKTATRNGLLKRFGGIEKAAAERGIATPAELQDLKRRLTGASLSYTDDGSLKKTTSIRELEVIERAVRSTSPAGKKGKNVGSVPLSNLGFGGPAPQPSTDSPEFVAEIEKAKKAAADRVAPLPSK